MINLKNIKLDNSPSNYIPSPGLLNALEVAYMLKRPLLLTGEPGTGKTQFAFWVADQLSRTEGFQSTPYIYNTKTSSTAQDLFYSYDAVAHFREIHTEQPGNRDADQLGDGGIDQPQRGGKTTEDFIQLKALGLAIANAIGRNDLRLSSRILDKSNVTTNQAGSVVLIDEIDKAPRDFPNDLLNEIENYEFEIKELNTRIKISDEQQKQKIIIILTSNFEKNLPDAFLRRCIYYHIDFPTKERLLEIITKRLDISQDDYINLEKRVNDFFQLHHYPNIIKRPSTSEFIDWIRVLQNDNQLYHEFFLEDKLVKSDALSKYLPILIKNKDDLNRLLA
ncbi:MAG TPA: MoxR family ATPase [Puia sp.]|nr:MoxR family ATPase [Puia sp.]